MMAADIVFESSRQLTTERINAKADRVNKIAMVFNAVAPIGKTTYIQRLALAIEEAIQRLFVVFVQPPEASPIVSRAARHQAETYLSTLFIGDVGTHNAIDSLGECTITTQDKYFVVAFLHQLTT